MKIHEIIKRKGKSVSCEFFPPKDQAGEDKLLLVIKQLEALGPDFVSVTYGAGGGTRKNTMSLIKRITEATALTPMPHLTCIDQSKKELKSILDNYRLLSVDNVLALRGDPPRGQIEFVAPKDGFCYAKDLVDLAATFNSFSIGVACYPEGHIEAPNRETDLLYTKQKIDAGAHFAITQMFFENRFYYDFLERAGKIGISVPIIPGIMPVTDMKKTGQFCEKCGATIPASLAARMESASPEDCRRIGREFAIEQCADLIKQGVRYFHFYSMNQAEAVTEIFQSLSLHTL
jgi:methylenetetrahydrofolate reductase (NADPH)